jgi:hypothetical protein
MLQELLIGAWFAFVCVGEFYFTRVREFARYEQQYPVFIYAVALGAAAIPLTTGQWWITACGLLPAMFVATTVSDRKILNRWAKSRQRRVASQAMRTPRERSRGDARVSVTIKVTNRLRESRALVIEPWLNEFLLAPGKSLDVMVTGDPNWPLEVEIEDDRFVVYGFGSAHSTVSVLDQGVRAIDVNAG